MDPTAPTTLSPTPGDLPDGPELDEHETPERDDAHGVEPGSILAQLHARREELAAETPELALDVPGYDGKLAMRVRYPEGGYKVIVGALERAQQSKDPDAILHANIDVITACCYTIVGRMPDDSLVDLETQQPAPMHEDVERRLRFDARIAAMLQIDVPDTVKKPVRFITRNVFSPRAQATGVYDGDVALITTGGRVAQWLQDTSKAATEELAGE